MAAHTDPPSTPRRPWRGVGADERQARRRAQLVEAAFTIMGTEGAAAVTMRGVCREAKLTERYFYESFSAREELLVTVLDEVARQAKAVLEKTLQDSAPAAGDLVRPVVRAFTEFVTADPRRGRVLFVESLAAPELAARGGELVAEFTATIAQALRSPGLAGEDADDRDVALNAQAVFGALAYLFQDWLSGRADIGRERFVEHVAQVIEQLARVTSVPLPR
ncbi:TetR/AcrR family transcriptional regulator [Amycolatopsis rhizosphaerae]|uniref:TetR/AcrR family transcriptional regulator n=1 Tax=Amycolatopsis rhizosphaerae TaxID=2053003 RepID=A0A558DD17_9PSEU|nr:TetR/AcrR family transcriptional regulator [Amycolatopsis rhizosphaerae]TVT58878.1 TetR/AcrR family transcriptional regulator [Amycolatopsis rhizosphaerae]